MATVYKWKDGYRFVVSSLSEQRALLRQLEKDERGGRLLDEARSLLIQLHELLEMRKREEDE